MPIKKLRVSFDIPIQQFLAVIAASNSAMKIDVYGDDPPPTRQPRIAKGQDVKMLEAPSKARGRGSNGEKQLSCIKMIAKHMIEHRERGVPVAELKPILIEAGLKPNSVSPQIDKLLKDGHAKRLRSGVYQITAKGVHAHG